MAARLAAILMLPAILALAGCAPEKGEGFAIYLARADVPPARMAALSHVDIAETPIAGSSDVLEYDAASHRITVSKAAYQRIMDLEVPVSGKSFIVCVDRKPVYSGAFWTSLSSVPFDGVVIMQPASTEGARAIRLDLGYPTPAFFRGDDPRANPEVLRSLGQAGKLVATATGR